jgi:hypothetical protein
MSRIKRSGALAAILMLTIAAGGCSLFSSKCPLEIVDLSIGSYSGTPTATVTVKNIGTKNLKAFEVRIYSWDVFGEKLKAYGNESYYGLHEGALKVGQNATATWHMYGFDTAYTIDVKVRRWVEESGKVRTDSWGTCPSVKVSKK